MSTVAPTSAQRVVLTQQMSVQEAMHFVASGECSIEQYLAWDAIRIRSLASKTAPRNVRFQCKRNSKGGIFIQHAKVRGYSVEKQKEYTASLNLPVGVAESLFADDAVLAEIAAGVRALVASEGKAAA